MTVGQIAQLDRRELVYLTPDDNIDEEQPLPLGYDVLEDLEFRRHPRLRRVSRLSCAPTAVLRAVALERRHRPHRAGPLSAGWMP
jgi:hypothetical protein